MKKLMLCFFAVLFFAPAAFSADVGAVSRGGASSDSNSGATTRSAARASGTVKSATVQRATPVQRNVSSNISATARDGATSGRATASRTIRDTFVGTTGATTSRDGAVAARSTGTRTNNAAQRRAGVSIRPSVAAGNRAIIDDAARNATRGVSARAATNVTAESIAQAKERLEQTAELNKSCQQQYNECMDQFCAVVDTNQKRCSCSANLSKYTKVESAVKDANTQLNEVAQRIRYVGLSADEIRAIMSATEAEEAMSGKTDTTETRNMLDEIEKMIKDPTPSSSYSTDTYSGLDIDLDFSADSGDMFSLDFLNTSNSSFSNLRGVELYNAAKRRCNAIITQCKDVGATSQQITGNYDLAIDKDCIAYEQGLTKMNETLVSNVRSANRMLQKARLAVLQNKNQYDAKGCIAALESCMTDDMVCGSDYAKCLDPTKKYIDENGNVVLGQNISNITTFMSNYDNAAINDEFLGGAETAQISDTACGNDGKCTVKYLLSKIGTGAKATDGGLCRPVLDKCQRYTYNGDNYVKYNDIVVNYIQRAMVNIKAAQQQIISDYASTCMTDIASCYNQQVSQINSWSSAANVKSIYNVMRGACRNVALTCAYAVFAADSDSCPTTGTGADNKCIENISNIFYQSLLCPDNSIYQQAEGTSADFVNAHCKCRTGYIVSGNSCILAVCGTNEERNSAGTCVCKDGYTRGSDGVCASSSPDKGDIRPIGPDSELKICDENEVYNMSTKECECPYPYEVDGAGKCSTPCQDTNMIPVFDAAGNGSCQCKSGYYEINGACEKCSSTDTHAGCTTVGDKIEQAEELETAP